MVDDPRFPSLASIRAFEAAARLGSFARAAQELGTSGASVSYHVRQLETQIGVPLFVRHPQRVALTPSGEVVAREAIDAFAALRASFVRAVDVDQARLALTALPTFGTSWLTPRLGRFRAANPDIALDLDLSPDPKELGTGRFDAAVRNGHGNWRGLRAVRLLPSLFMPLCAPSLRFEPDRLEAPLLGRPDWWALWYRALGMPPPAAASFGTTFAAEHLDVAAALAGHGIAIASPILFRAEIDAGRLVPAHELAASDGRSFWFAWPVARQQSRKIERFRAWLEDEAAQARSVSADIIARAVTIAP